MSGRRRTDATGATWHPWDEGLQNERTTLSWQRTLLSGLTCSLLIARLLADVSPVGSLLLGGTALGVTAGLAVVALRRYNGTHVSLVSRARVGDGVLPVLTTALVTATALGALAYVMAS